MSNEWLANLKVGDHVVLSGRDYQLSRVARFTSAWIIVANGQRYRKSDGCSVGESGFDGSCLIELTPEIRNGMRCKRLANQLRVVEWHRLSLETLVAINGLLPKKDGVTP